MALPLPIARIHSYEINDQTWFPQAFREMVQDCLTKCWTLQFPILQSASPATLAARTLQAVLGPTLRDYTFVDFCAGAGGPTPQIEQQLNEALRSGETGGLNSHTDDSIRSNSSSNRQGEGVDFILTDLHPHIRAWTLAAKQSPYLRYVPGSVDAANAPKDLLVQAGYPTYGTTSKVHPASEKKIFRLYCLAFHHFADPLAIAILRNTFASSSGFAIIELQGRDLGNVITVLLLAPLMWLGSWWWFWGKWGHLFFTYVIPVVPFVVVYDGLVSCLRTRRWGEVMDLVSQAEANAEREKEGAGTALLRGWRFQSGGEVHTKPGGTMQWIAGIKE